MIPNQFGITYIETEYTTLKQCSLVLKYLYSEIIFFERPERKYIIWANFCLGICPPNLPNKWDLVLWFAKYATKKVYALTQVHSYNTYVFSSYPITET